MYLQSQMTTELNQHFLACQKLIICFKKVGFTTEQIVQVWLIVKTVQGAPLWSEGYITLILLRGTAFGCFQIYKVKGKWGFPGVEEVGEKEKIYPPHSDSLFIFSLSIRCVKLHQSFVSESWIRLCVRFKTGGGNRLRFIISLGIESRNQEFL